MAKGTYSGADSVARRVRKGHTGVQAAARRIRRGYTGIGGVARPCWSCGEVEYFGTITPLNVSRAHCGAASNGGYALFAGGRQNAGLTNTVDVYNTKLTISTAAVINEASFGMGAAAVGEYAVFAGGNTNTTNLLGALNTVNAYSGDLVKTNPTATAYKKSFLAAASVGNYALFSGGYDGGNTTVSTAKHTVVDCYDASLVHSSTSTSGWSYDAVGTNFGPYALITGGSASTIVNAFDTSLARTVADPMSIARWYGAITVAGTNAIMIGGHVSTDVRKAVDAYTEDLTHVVLPDSSVIAGLAGASLENRAIFAGGSQGNSSVFLDEVIVYDENLTVMAHDMKLSSCRQFLNAAVIADFALFAGGWIDANKTGNTVDVFTVT